MSEKPTVSGKIDTSGTLEKAKKCIQSIPKKDSIIRYSECLKLIRELNKPRVLTFDRLKELLKRTIEVCGDKENTKFSSYYDEFIEELMKEIGMTEEEYNELFEEDK